MIFWDSKQTSRLNQEEIVVPKLQNKRIAVFLGRIGSVELLGNPEKPEWKQGKDGLYVKAAVKEKSLPVVMGESFCKMKFLSGT